MVIMLEPRISGIRANELIKKSGFVKSHRVEAIGYSRGIWLLWRDLLDVEVVFNHKQFIHFRIINNSGILSWITTVYASLVHTNRQIIWDHLGRLANNTQGPWLIGGDFNAILNALKKRGGSSHRSGICRSFLNWFLSSNLYES